MAKRFGVSDQQALRLQHDTLTLAMRRLQYHQPSFKAFLREQLEQAFPGIRPLDVDALLANHSRADGGTPHNLDPTSASLLSAAKAIAAQYPAALQAYWTTPRKVERNPKVMETPLNQMLALHKQQLSTLAALRVSDGTLSAAGKQLIDAALQYPTLAERESTFANGVRPGVYPLTIDDGTERGALLAGAFLITKTDGSWVSQPTWTDTRNIALNGANGPVVLYTPGEGFEEFATPAQARDALANRLDEGGVKADLLRQTLPLALQNRADPPSGSDLMDSVAPLDGDVLAEGISWMLNRQQTELEASQAQAPLSSTATDAAADWSYLLDGSNALLARDNLLADLLQPEWLKKLSPTQQTVFAQLEQTQEESAATLAPLFEKIPSLATFARDRMNEAIKKQYPTAQVDADQLRVKVRTRTHIHSGQITRSKTPYQTNISLTLTDLALKNPTAFPAVETGKFTQTTLTLALTDKQGNPVLGADGKQVVLNTDQLKALVNTADVGGDYARLLKKELATDAVSGAAGERRAGWKTNQLDQMQKEAYLAELNPNAFKAEARDDTTRKRGAQWIAAVMNHPDPSDRPQVDGQTIVAHALLQRGVPVQGVMVIGNSKDSERVLYTPNAPDGITFREVPNQQALNTLLNTKEWKLYTAGRKSPVSKSDVVKAGDALKQYASDVSKNPAVVIDLISKFLKLTDDTFTLQPMAGNTLDALYKQQVQLVVDKADHQSVSSAEVAEQSRTNKVQFGIEVASIFLDLVPVVGKGISTGVRLGKAGVTALRANARLLPKLLKNPGLSRTIYADFATAGAGIPLVRTTPLRPVAKVPVRALEPNHLTTPKVLQATHGPAPAVPSTSRGIVAPAPAPPTNTQLNRDLSAYAVPDQVIQGRAMGSNGTYNVDGNWYVRFTDGTGENRVYQIESTFHAKDGRVTVIDPHAPPTASRSSRVVGFLEATGNGEWHQQGLSGGRRGAQRRQSPTPPVEYVDYLFAGGADFTVNSGTRGTARRWFRNDMDNFFHRQASGALPPRPNMQSTPPGSTPGDLLRTQLQNANGLVLGEQHNQVAVDALLIQNMPLLRESGVTTLLLEGAPGIGLIPYTAADVQMIPSRPRNAAYQNNTPSRMAVYEAAEQNGIKIVGIEHEHLTQHVTRSATDDSLNLKHTNDRQKELNYYTKKVIDQIPQGEKWVAVVGRSHMSTSRGVPGIAELTGVPGVGVYDGARGSVSVTRPTTGQRPDPQQRLGVNDIAGDYQIHQNVDEYLKPLPTR